MADLIETLRGKLTSEGPLLTKDRLNPGGEILPELKEKQPDKCPVCGRPHEEKEHTKEDDKK